MTDRPVIPPMIAWQRAGEPGWPFHHPGGPLPGSLNWRSGEQLAFRFDEDKPVRAKRKRAA
jgi:hypothetical protein